MGFAFPFFVVVGKFLLLFLFLAFVVDLALLFGQKNPISGERVLEDKLSNGDLNPIRLLLSSRFNFKVALDIIDEFPNQLQLRDKVFRLEQVQPNKEYSIDYEIRPVERGEYQFGNLNIFASTPIGLAKRRVIIDANAIAKVYPSFIQLRKYSFLTISNRLEEIGVRKVRKLGVSQEFEQIREYVTGDDYKLINWKATAKRNALMVNQYQEEKSQHIYCVVDKGRLMHMPFDGLSLIDYSINAALVMSSIAIGRGDKAGLITFSDKIGSFISTNSKGTQMNTIVESLYNQETRLRESDFLRLYKNVKIKIKKRSLMLLFTNFDSMVSLNRQLKYLKSLNKTHLLCAIIFDNSEINRTVNAKATTEKEVYLQTSAEKFLHEKRLIVKELNKNGIYTILTEPQNLTVNTINTYIQMKAKGAI